jgi:3-oxoacyl-[acyl-carrier protein] reductase
MRLFMTAKEQPQVVIVTGGSRGLGLAIVQRLLARGDCVATCSRSETDSIKAIQSDAKLADRFMFSAVDAADADGIRHFVRSVYDRFGSLTALVNNAAVAHDGVLATMPEESLDQMLQVNLRGALLFAKECSRLMLLGEGGRIVSISSIVADNGFSGLAVYSATKAALLGMTRALARELGPKNIRVNAIAPGFLETDLSKSLSARQREQIVRRTPLGRLGKSDDIVPAVEFLLSPASAFITGQVLTVDGGATA